MFYCDECRKRNDWPVSILASYGECEVCGKSSHCHDVPCSSLPPVKRRLPVELSPNPFELRVDQETTLAAGRILAAEKAMESTIGLQPIPTPAPLDETIVTYIANILWEAIHYHHKYINQEAAAAAIMWIKIQQYIAANDLACVHFNSNSICNSPAVSPE